MKIKSYKKLKNGKFQLVLDNFDKIEVYEDVILNLELLIKKNITNNLVDKINIENKKYDCYYMALKYLKVRVRSQKEIYEYLSKKDFSKEDIMGTIEILSKQGYINDYNFAKAFLGNKLITTSNGPYKIKNDLKEKGISSDIIDSILEDYTIDIQKEKIMKRINIMIKSNRNRGNNLLKKKIYNDLVKQGFERSIVERLLEEIQLDGDRALLEKKYNKLYRNLSRKYQGEELEYRIRQKLYQKGFESFQ